MAIDEIEARTVADLLVDDFVRSSIGKPVEVPGFSNSIARTSVERILTTHPTVQNWHGRELKEGLMLVELLLGRCKASLAKEVREHRQALEISR